LIPPSEMFLQTFNISHNENNAKQKSVTDVGKQNCYLSLFLMKLQRCLNFSFVPIQLLRSISIQESVLPGLLKATLGSLKGDNRQYMFRSEMIYRVIRNRYWERIIRKPYPQIVCWYDNTSNLYPIYTKRGTRSYSIRLS